jgi:membrane protein YqaA with SNARE-associated domain
MREGVSLFNVAQHALFGGLEHLAEYAALFTASFLSATVFPFQSEVVLFGMLVAEHYTWWALVLVASAGNTLGSIANWLLGRLLAVFEDRPWFPVSRKKIAKAEHWYHRYGRWSLLLSWVPIIGDPLTIVAGVLREPLPIFVLLVAVAKTARYFAVAALSFGWM